MTATTPANPAGSALDSDGKESAFFLARWHLGIAGICALVYDWCHDVLSPPERETLKTALLTKGIELFQESPPLQKAVLFRETGHAILRSPDLWLAYNGGWISDRSHSNCDLGSFVLVAGQERLVHDPGYGDGETGQHSTVLVGGRGQRRGGRGEFLRFGSGRRFHYLASDLSKVYEDPSLQRFVRHMVMVDGSYLVIFDDLQADSPADFEWRLQTRHTVTVNADRAVVQGQQWNLQVHNALAGQTMETAVWRRQHKEESLTCLSIRVEAASAMTFLTVLFPVRKEQGAAMPEVRCQTPGVVEVTRGELISDRIVFEKRKDHWTLTTVNDEDAEGIPNGNARTLKAFRADADSQNSGVRSQDESNSDCLSGYNLRMSSLHLSFS